MTALLYVRVEWPGELEAVRYFPLVEYLRLSAEFRRLAP